MRFFRYIIMMLLSTVTAACFIAAAIMAFAGLAAWEDYKFRGCPNANQCSDAVATMWVVGILAPLTLLLAIGIARFLSKTSPWRAGRSL